MLLSSRNCSWICLLIKKEVIAIYYICPVETICYIGAFIQWSLMEDQQLKALIAESLKEVKDSFAKDLHDMRCFFQEMEEKIVLVYKLTSHWWGLGPKRSVDRRDPCKWYQSRGSEGMDGCVRSSRYDKMIKRSARVSSWCKMIWRIRWCN